MTDVKKGLTADEVEQLTNDGMVNVSVGKQSKTIGQIVAGNVFTYFNLIFAAVFMFIAIYFLYYGILFAVPHFLIGAGLTICDIRHMYFAKMSIKKHTPIFSIDKNGLQQNYKIRWHFLEPLKIPRTISWKQIEKIETYKPIICINHDNHERISICVAGQSEITLNFFVIGIDHEHNYRTLLFYWKLFRNNGQ